jgi:superfamily II DNA or RNA helicase
MGPGFFISPRPSPFREEELKIFIGNCYSRLDSYTPELEEALTVAHENYFFSQKYRSGMWDGKTHFLKIPSLRFPSGLLHMVTQFCDACGTDYQIIDERDRPDYNIDCDDLSHVLTDITLRPYQEEAVISALAAERGCLEMATGSGKTEVAATIIKIIGRRTLFLVHTKDLLRQAQGRLEQRLGVPVGMYGEGIHDTEADVCVATVQSVDSFLQREEKACKSWLASFEVLFLDECHHTSARSWHRIGLLTPAYYRFGLSGTVLRKDNLSNVKMLSVFGGTIYKLSSHDLIGAGYLSEITVKLINNPERIVGSSWQTVYASGVVNSEIRNGKIAEIVQDEFNHDKRILVLIRQIEHGKILLDKMDELGLPAVFLSGSDSSGDRAETIKKFMDDERFILISSTIFDEGVDIPAVNVIVVASGGKSEIKAIQRIGRGLRKKADQTNLTVYDFMDNSKFLKEHSAKRKSVYRKEKFI